MDPVGLRCRRHENRQGCQPQDVLPHPPTGESGYSVKSRGTDTIARQFHVPASCDARLRRRQPGSGHEALVTVASMTVTQSCGSGRPLPRTRNS